jgi:hypothetical protein
MKTMLTILAVGILLAAGAAVFVWTGGFNIAATDPHWDITLQMIEVVRDRSIAVHSRSVSLPPFDESKLLRTGAGAFQEMCRDCHGAPGQPSEAFAQGLYPAPANLLSGEVQAEWSDKELFWIVQNGLKMTGMPAFGSTLEKEELMGAVALLRRLPKLGPGEYAALTQKAGSE